MGNTNKKMPSDYYEYNRRQRKRRKKDSELGGLIAAGLLLAAPAAGAAVGTGVGMGAGYYGARKVGEGLHAAGTEAVRRGQCALNAAGEMVCNAANTVAGTTREAASGVSNAASSMGENVVQRGVDAITHRYHDRYIPMKEDLEREALKRNKKAVQNELKEKIKHVYVPPTGIDDAPHARGNLHGITAGDLQHQKDRLRSIKPKPTYPPSQGKGHGASTWWNPTSWNWGVTDALDALHSEPEINWAG